jgi:hypothetical protein
MRPTRLDYCQFLCSSHTNFTMTYFAEHGAGFSHDAVNRMLRRDKLTPRLVWEHVKSDVITSPPDGHPNSPTYGHLKLPHLN